MAVKARLKKVPRRKRFAKWLKNNKIPLGAIATLISLYTGYANFDVDPLRNEIYQPLYKEINTMEHRVQANNMETRYSTESYESLRKSGAILGQLPFRQTHYLPPQNAPSKSPQLNAQLKEPVERFGFFVEFANN